MRDDSCHPKPMFQDEYRPPRDNWHHYCNILETRIMTLDAFLENQEKMALEEDKSLFSSAIPVLLLPQETTAQYEQRFELFLLKRNVTMGSIRGDPVVERRFRLDFADSRAWELRRRRIQKQHQSGDSKWPKREIVRSRRELLAKEVVSSSFLLETNEYEGLNGRLKAGEKLRPIPMVLNRDESIAEYEDNFTRWLNTKRVTFSMMESNPEEERRYRQCFAYVRASQQKRVVRERGRRRARRYEDVRKYRSPSSSRIRSPSRKRNTPREFQRRGSDQTEKRSRRGSDSNITVFSIDEEVEVHEIQPNTEKLLILEEIAKENTGDSVKASSTEDDSQNDAILQKAKQLLEKVIQDDSSRASRELIAEYSRASEQIVLNEMVVNDALGCMEQSSDTSDLGSMDQASEIAELEDLVSQKKRHRDATLAAILAEVWREKQQELAELLENLPVASSSHEKLVSIFEKRNDNAVSIQRLQVKVSNRLSWMLVAGTRNQNQFDEMKELMNKLDHALEERLKLTHDHEVASINLLRSNEDMRMLVTELIEESEHIWE